MRKASALVSLHVCSSRRSRLLAVMALVIVAHAGRVAGQAAATAEKSADIEDMAYRRIDAVEFQSQDPEGTQFRTVGRLYATAGSGVYVAAVHLPQGARLASLQLDACDANSDGDHVMVALSDCDRFGNCGGPLATIESVSRPNNPCGTFKSDLTSTGYVVDEQARGLFLKVTFGSRDRSTSLTGVLVGYRPAAELAYKGSRTLVWQGSNKRQFHSPMMLELPLPTLSAASKDWFDSREAVNLYECDGVRIALLRLRITERGAAGIGLGVQSMLSNPHGHDKGVTLDIAVVSGSSLISSCRIGPVKVDETDSKRRETECVIPRASLDGSSTPILRIAMSVSDL